MFLILVLLATHKAATIGASLTHASWQGASSRCHLEPAPCALGHNLTFPLFSTDSHTCDFSEGSLEEVTFPPLLLIPFIPSFSRAASFFAPPYPVLKTAGLTGCRKGSEAQILQDGAKAATTGFGTMLSCHRIWCSTGPF